METILSVTQIINYINKDFELKYRKISIIGEISSFKSWRSGHWYFDLKDEQSLISGIMFKNFCEKIQFNLADGLQVIAIGRLNVYASQSKIQIIVEQIEPVGIGVFTLAFNQLKDRLEKEGLFRETHKKKLPFLPKTIGIITSPQGAALQDMMRILNARMSGINIIIAPVKVQGPGSAQEIKAAINRLDKDSYCDVIIIGRGGGSIEDLCSFNEEIVARAIFSCTVPIISAVGHETDFTIADFVADMRCATPTHAAQIVVPNKKDLLEKCALLKNRFYELMQLIISQNRFRLINISGKLFPPKSKLFQYIQTLDSLMQKLEKTILNCLKKANENLSIIDHKLNKIFYEKFHKIQERYIVAAVKLEAFSPLKVLSRGYGIIYLNDKPVSSVGSLLIGDNLNLRLIDGRINVQIKGIYEF